MLLQHKENYVWWVSIIKKKKGEKKRKKHLKFSDLVGNYFMAFKSSDVNVCNRNDGVFVCVSPLLTVNS